jgi:hypothetical protein
MSMAPAGPGGRREDRGGGREERGEKERGEMRRRTGERVDEK